MKISSLINKYKEKGVLLWTEKGALKYRAPEGALTRDDILELKNFKENIINYLEELEIKFAVNPKDRYKSFSLTDIQQSYVVGRKNVYELGGIGCHGYVELMTEDIISIKKLEIAWNKVIQKHDMLRAIIYPEGYQRVQEKVPYFNVIYQDLRGESEEKEKEKFLRLRESLSNKQYELGKWGLCDLALTLLSKKSVIHFSLDMLIADFVSAKVILNDLDKFYYEELNGDNSLNILYKDVISFLEKKKETPSGIAKREKDKEYWKNKILDMNGSPELPINKNTDYKNRFIQKKCFIEKDHWEKIIDNAKKRGVTPSNALMAAYLQTIGLWSKKSSFCINVTLLNRPEVYSGIDKVVGDFTSVNVLSVDIKNNNRFIDFTKVVQKELWKDLAHSSFSGVEVLREMSRLKQENIVIPIVYTSTVGVENENQSHEFMRNTKLTYKISQTPQVWIDCQVAKQDGGLLINWDIREGVFKDKVIKDMFDSYISIIKKMVNDNIFEEKFPAKLPEKMRETRIRVNDTDGIFHGGHLYDYFIKNVEKNPGKLAVVTLKEKFTYRKLRNYVASIQRRLLKNNISKGDKVIVLLPKGIWQIASVLGITMSGAVYVPVDISQPISRIESIAKDSKAKFIISSYKNNSEKLKDINIINVEDIEITEVDYINAKEISEYDTAYIIYTSGSTGKPKGVVISHAAALNTILDINDRFKVKEVDVFLGLASLAFDLSVYDIFGSLTAGGTIVLPEQELLKDPSHWLSLINKFKVTIWNSVPAQMQMLITCIKSDETYKNMPLKLVLMSGDWIPVTLPEKIYDYCSNAKVISLGGATEASIWSIYFEIPKHYKSKNSIPYGRALKNQKMYVLNKNLQICPYEVEGDIYIGGVGLASGYMNDVEITNRHFIKHPITDERLYYTGDLGRYDEDGIIEFLGREDSQVKVHGHRIELSEIESALIKNPSVSTAVVLALDKEKKETKIKAFVEPKKGKEDMVDESRNNKLKEYCYDKLRNSSKYIEKCKVDKWMKIVERTMMYDMWNSLNNMGVFKDSRVLYDFEHIKNLVNVDPNHEALLKRWLDAFESKGLINKKDDFYYKKDLVKITLEDSKNSWEELKEVDYKIKIGGKMLDYLKLSSSFLIELLQGKEDPLELLFPKGSVDTAMSAYHDNYINYTLNQIVKDTIIFNIREKNKEKPFKILEIGAGVGGTTKDLLPELEKYNVEYCFSDVSPFFINEARKDFSNYDWISYKIFDVNKDFREQGIEEFSFDMVLCANVLHNSKNIPFNLKRLSNLLSKGGKLLVLEATYESFMMLSSMEFKDGLSGYTDVRQKNGVPFLTKDQWENYIEEANGNLSFEYPQKKDSLENVGQSVFEIEFNSEFEKVSKEELNHYLKSLLPDYMIPYSIEILSKMPVNNNGKIDRKELLKNIKDCDEDKKEGLEGPKNDLEKKITKIWEKILNNNKIGRNDNFYDVGGDSLLIAQIVSQMKKELLEIKKWEWDRVMLEILKEPTIASISYKIKNNIKLKEEEANDQIMSFSELNDSDCDDKIRVFVHDGTGKVSPYNNLLKLIEENSLAPMKNVGFAVGNFDKYLKIPTADLIKTLGEEYANKLLDLDCNEFEIIGYCMGGLIGIEMAKVLNEAGKKVNLVVTIDSIPCEVNISNEILFERAYGLLVGSDIKKAGHEIDDDRLKRALLNKKKDEDLSTFLENVETDIGISKNYKKLLNQSQRERIRALFESNEKEYDKSDRAFEKFFNFYKVFCKNFEAVALYKKDYYVGKVLALGCKNISSFFLPIGDRDVKSYWESMTLGDFNSFDIEGDHISCMKDPFVKDLYNGLVKEGVL